MLFRQFRFSSRLLLAIFKKHKRLIFLSFVLGILAFWLGPQIYRLSLKKNETKIGFIGKFAVNELPLEIQQLIGQGLTSVANDGQIQPLLAESWQIKDNGKEYIFKLKDHLFWHDGEPVLAKDISYPFGDVAAAPQSEKEIKFQLKEPFSPFLAVVSRPVFKEELVGTGQYQVKKIKKNGQIIEVLTLTPYQDKKKPRLIFRFYPTEESLKTAFKLGEIDTIWEISQAVQFKQWPGLQIEQKIKFSRFVAIFFNTQSPKLAEKSVRQALAYAIKKDWPNRVLGPINPRSWAYNPQVKKYEFDLANSQKLLGQAGEGSEKMETIELATIPSLLPVAEQIKEDWAQLNINTKVKLITNPQEEFEALLISQETGFDPDQYTLWHSTQKGNLSGYRSFKIDNLLEEGRKIQDLETRKTIYQEFQKVLVEDMPAVFLFHPTVYTVSRHQVVL